jgi:hypothetical protein
VFQNIPMGIQSAFGDGSSTFQRQGHGMMPNQHMFAPISQLYPWPGYFNGPGQMPMSPLLPMHANFFDNDTETLIGTTHDDSTILTDVTMGTGVSISDYGSELQMTGRLVGHFETVEYGNPRSTSFHLDDLVYIEDGFGVKHMGYLLGSVVANNELRQDFSSDGMPRLHPGCPHHGLDCVLGKYMAEAAKETADLVGS